MKKKLLTFLISILFLSHPVFADGMLDDDEDYNNDEYPKITGEILTEYSTDTLINSSSKVDTADDRTNGQLNLEPIFKLHLNDKWSFKTAWKFRPVEERLYQGDIWARNASYIVGGNGTDDRYGKEDYIERKFQWDTYGLIIEELTVDFRGEDLAFGLGKFNPTFGKAFDKSKYHGIYGTWMPEQYELTEKFGAYVSMLFENAELRFNLFFDDTTGMSRSAFKDRKRDKSAGGAGNTEKPNNYSLTLEGNYEQFGYNVGFRYLDTDKSYEKNEKGFVLGLDYLKEFETNNFIFIPFAEVAYFDNFDGMNGREIWYTTVSLPLIYKGWNVVVSETFKHDDEPTYKDYQSYLAQFSIGYKFKNGIMLDFARKEQRYVIKANNIPSPQKDSRKADSWGLMISYMYKF